MATYITVADVDAILGPDWVVPELKDESILRGECLPDCAQPGRHRHGRYPGDVKQAGARLAKCASQEALLQQAEGSLEAKTVKAGSVSTSKSWTVEQGQLQQPSRPACSGLILYALA